MTQNAPNVKAPRPFSSFLRTDWAGLAGIVLLALSLRIYQIGAESLWTDEWLSLEGAGRIEPLNRHRPLFYIALRGWMLFGSGDVWARSLALLFGVSSILLLYFVGRRLAGRPAALVACLFMAIAVPELNHSQEVRMYTMASALTLASLFALIEWVRKQRTWILGVHLVLTYLAFLTTPTTIFGLLLAGAMAALLLLYRSQRKAMIMTAVAYVTLVLAWWPLKRYAALAVSSGSFSWIPRPTHFAVLSLHGSLLTDDLGLMSFTELSHLLLLGVSLLAIFLVGAALLAAWRQQPSARGAVPVAAWFYAIVGGMYITSVMKTSVWHLRYFHYASPALYLLLAIGVVSLARWRRSIALTASGTLVALTAIAAADYYRLNVREDWRGIAVTIAKEAAPQDVIALVGPEGLFDHYYVGSAKVCKVWPNLGKMPQQTHAVLTDFLGQVVPHVGRTWIVLRLDARFDKVGFVERFEQYLLERGTPPRIRTFLSAQGRIALVDFAGGG